MDIKNVTNYIVRTDTIQNYLHDIKAIKPMTAQEEKDLFAKYEDFKDEEQLCKDIFASIKLDDEKTKEYQDRMKRAQDMQIAIRNEIISRNLRFNFAVAKRYDNNELLPDLVNVGMLGMYEAFQEYDWHKDVRFCSFAVWYIRRSINAYLVKENLIVRPKNGNKYSSKVKKIANKFYLENGRNPSEEEIIEILKKDYDITVKDPSDIYGIRVDYLESSVGEDDDNVFEKSAVFTEKTAVENEFESKSDDDELSYAMNKAMSTLTEREAKIIKMSSGYGYDKEYKDKEIAQIIGLTSERVRQIRHEAIDKMKYAYASAVSD
jgi:RNA polymerase primary sigma factor